MKRDFSDSTKERLLNLVKQVENEKWCDFTDWIGDRWYDFQDWIGRLDIKRYINNINQYHKRVIDKNNTSVDAINRIFEEVNIVNVNYKGRFSFLLSDLHSYNDMLSMLSDIVTPSNGCFAVQYINSSSKRVTLYVESSINIQKQVTEGLTVFQDELDLQDIVTSDDISEDNVKERKSINISEFHPLIGLSQTMMETDDSAEALVEVPVALDAANFIISWLHNSQGITQLQVITSNDGKMAIEYGLPIENKYSGQRLSLYTIIVDKFYDYSPSILFTANDKADEMIRSWFGLSGDGKYSMEFNFGKVNIGECGYKLIFENGEMYQVPIIHEGTTMKVYYKEDGQTTEMFDAADILRNTKIKVSEEETKKVLDQLRHNGFIQ